MQMIDTAKAGLSNNNHYCRYIQKVGAMPKLVLLHLAGDFPVYPQLTVICFHAAVKLR